MRKNRFSTAPRLLAAILFFFTCNYIQAQYENGSLVGTIRDKSGAAVSGAAVTITNNATAVTAKATTNDSGDYEIPSLRVGVYTISASAPGFAYAVAQNITVSVGARQRIDLSLTVGATQTSVEVSDVALQIETESSQRGQIITQYQSAAFPLVTRNYSDLLGLVTGSRQAPTAATTSSINSLVRAGAYNINGQRSMFNNFLLDGIDNNAYGESNQGFDNQIIAVPPDSVAQFQVVTNNESAEYGRSSGATINVASSSGTNRFHATVYEFIRNTDLNAAGYFKPTTVGGTGNVIPFQKPTFNRNQFGVNFGGPILRDKLFYFVDYEGFRQTLKPLSVFTLPTQNELNGVLVVPVRNPITGATYAAGTTIPASAINPISQQIIGFFKQIPGLPQSGLPSTGLASNDYSKQVPFTDNSDKGDLRLDYQQNANNSWFLRISDRKEAGVNYPALPLPLDGQTNGTIRVLDQQVALGYTRLLGANKVIDARLGLSRTKAGKFSLSIGNNAITIPGLPSDPTVAGGLPSTSITGFTAFGRQSTNPQWQNPALIDPKINFTWVKGKHSLKFGYEYEHVWMAVNDNNPLYGSFSYAGGYSLCPAGTVIPGSSTRCSTASATSDNYWADFLFGLTNNYSLANYFVAHLRQSLDSVYAQDDWHVNNKLTLNLGLRWEYGSPYSEQKNYISNFDPASQTVLTITPGATPGNGITPFSGGGVYGKTLVNPDLNDFGPRIGFAYAATPRIAIHGGYGISYVHYTRAGSGDILAINAPQAQFAGVVQPTPTGANHCNPLPAQIIPVGSTTPSCYATVDQGYPSGLVTTFNKATDNITWVPRNTRDSSVQSYFVSVQQELAKNTLLDIAYVGNHGTKLQGFLNGNQKNPAAGFARPFGNWPSDITTALNEFYSHYDALQVRYEQRFVAGLTLLNSFTWSHSLDNASASLEGNTPSPQDANNIAADYGQSDYNLPVSNVTSVVYDLPAGHGRRFLSNSSALVNTLLGGWQISAINTMQAGTPFNVGYSANSANAVSPQISATYRGANEYRPNIVPGQPIIKRTKLSSGFIQYTNLAAFTLPATKDAGGNLLSPFGNASRNPGRTPAFYQTDLALNKKFDTPLESLKVEFRSEAYNVFNHTNLYLPGSGLGGTLSTPTQLNSPTTGGQITSTFEPRILQFGVKVIY
jgi:Carboxypeptidase regulatory-like domain/TonB dependent receptor/TonB-dependent Receptor Plug Domain